MDLYIRRIIVEVRYLPVFRFVTHAEEYFQSLLGDYTGVTHKQSEFSLKNDQGLHGLFVSEQRAGISFEHNPSDELVQRELKRLSELLKRMSVTSFQRLGVRMIYSLPMTTGSFSDNIEKYSDYLLRRENQVVGSELIEDMAVTLEGKVNNRDFRIITGVVRKDEAVTKLRAEYESDDEPLHAISIDHDLWQVGPKDYELSKVEKLMKDNKSSIRSYSKKLEGSIGTS